MNHQLLKKSINARNIQAIKEQVNREDNWVDYMPPIPRYVKPKKIQFSVGLWNLVRQLRP
jgi:hypothetical protein